MNKQITNLKERQSNIELLRIVLMFMIVLHHYCVNSGLSQVINFASNPLSTIIMQFLSFGGKVGVTGFFIITGYFMINGVMKIEKLLKFILQIIFYNILIYLCLHFFGYDYTIKQTITTFIPIVFGLPYSFIGSYFFIYILTPIINPFLQRLSRNQFVYLLTILIIFYSIIGTFCSNTWHYFGWGLTTYFIGAFIKLHNFKYKDNRKFWIGGGVISLLAMWGFMLLCDILGKPFFNYWAYMMSDANKLFILTISISMFLCFLTINIGYKKYINKMATAVFGVLLIHANSDVMRQWLWKDTLNNVDVYLYSTPAYFLFHMIISCVTIYLICTIIELIRINFIEKPLFTYMGNGRFVKWNNKIKSIATIK
jgi:hypothetical protein